MTYKRSSSAPDIRFIRLGRAGRWAKPAIEGGEMPFGYRYTPHDLALTGDRAALTSHFRAQGQKPSAATQSANEVLAFYEAAPERIWVTAYAGRLWWAKAAPDVIWTGDQSDAYGARLRRVVGGWRSTDVQGRALDIDQLSSALTKMRRCQRTICLAPADLWALIHAEHDNSAEVVIATRARLDAGVGALIAKLDEADFEVFVGMALEGAGWTRTSAIGGAQEDIDLVVMQPLVGVRAGVQVKSSATGRKLRTCAERILARGYAFAILACHTLQGGSPVLPGKAMLLSRERLAQLACNAGLIDWLIEKTRGLGTAR